jgi:hypothetical protein
MVASPDTEHLEEVRGTIATYLKAVKANDIATLRGLFDAKANVAHYHVNGISSLAAGDKDFARTAIVEAAGRHREAHPREFEIDSLGRPAIGQTLAQAHVLRFPNRQLWGWPGKSPLSRGWMSSRSSSTAAMSSRTRKLLCGMQT